MLVDFHTHHPAPSTATHLTIRSYSLPERRRPAVEEWHTIGLHPWHSGLADAPQLVEKSLPTLLAVEQCLALGEVGLDRLRGGDLKRQRELLERQLDIAQSFGLPAVFHCVRAWSELHHILRQTQFHPPRAIHGFRGKLDVLDSLLNDNFYISIGPNSRGDIPDIITAVPKERLLLETDDSPLSIVEVYKRAAHKLQVDEKALAPQVYANVQAFFARSFADKSCGTTERNS